MTNTVIQIDDSEELSGTFTPTGLFNGGLVTVVSINQTTWTAIPASAIANRNAINIQNYSGQESKINYSSGIVGYVGMAIPDRGERQYAITDAIVLYAKSATSTVSINVEELS